MPLTINQARTKALEVITAGLQSGSIKLNGTSGGTTPEAAASGDVKYLTMLTQGLVSLLMKDNNE